MSRTDAKKFPLTSATIARIQRRALSNKNELENSNEKQNEIKFYFKNIKPNLLDSNSSQNSVLLPKSRSFPSGNSWSQIFTDEKQSEVTVIELKRNTSTRELQTEPEFRKKRIRLQAPNKTEQNKISTPLYLYLSPSIVGCGIYYLWRSQKGPIMTFQFVTGAFTVLASFIIWHQYRNTRYQPSENKVVIITGCDQDIGFSLASHALLIGFTVFGCCEDMDGAGIRRLRKMSHLTSQGAQRLNIIQMDITNNDSIEKALERIHVLFGERPGLRLTALVNSVRFIAIGEFAWQSENFIKNQININLIGPLQFTRALCPLLRLHQARIINMNSHYGFPLLPGFAVLSATQAALDIWSASLRVEQAKCKVPVINLIPNSLLIQKTIAEIVNKNSSEMENLLEESERRFYSKYFQRFFKSITLISKKEHYQQANADLQKIFEKALLSAFPQRRYVNSSWRDFFYRFLIKFSPVWLQERLALKFMRIPNWQGDF